MPEQPWVLTDVAPVSLGQGFTAVPAGWALTYWGGPASMLFGSVAGSALLSRPLIVMQAVARAAHW